MAAIRWNAAADPSTNASTLVQILWNYCKFQDPAKLTRVIADLIDAEQWSSLTVDVNGYAYEGLLEKNAQDTENGAAQYFAPRAVIQAMVTCVAPRPGKSICDPACGTGGFLLSANYYITLKTNPMRVEDLMEFARLYKPMNRHQRIATWSAENPDGRWRAYDYDELVAQYKARLDIFWLRDDALADSDNPSAPEVIAQEIVDDLEAALEQFRLIAGDLAADG